MATAASGYVTPEEYLERERKAEFKSEYFRGQIVAMGGASRYHGRIVTNLIQEIGQQLRNRDCNLYASELRVSVSRAGMYAYPDIVVTCGEEKFVDDAFDTLLNPVLIIEVLSKSTQIYDRGQKFEAYRCSESLSEYVMVAQDKMQLEQYTRQQDGRWLFGEWNRPADLIRFESIGVDVPLSNIYAKIDFP